jgi:hypothetical protein
MPVKIGPKMQTRFPLRRRSRAPGSICFSPIKAVSSDFSKRVALRRRGALSRLRSRGCEKVDAEGGVSSWSAADVGRWSMGLGIAAV